MAIKEICRLQITSMAYNYGVSDDARDILASK
jgi:hypothetical protein